MRILRLYETRSVGLYVVAIIFSLICQREREKSNTYICNNDDVVESSFVEEVTIIAHIYERTGAVDNRDCVLCRARVLVFSIDAFGMYLSRVMQDWPSVLLV